MGSLPRLGSRIRAFPGVYRVGHAAPSVEANYTAAVLACGDGSVARKREREAYARGDQFRRDSWGDVVERPGPVLTELRAVLAPV